MALGTGIALLPERSFAFAMEKLPAGAAATTTIALLLMLLASGASPVYARRVLSGAEAHAFRCTDGFGMQRTDRASVGLSRATMASAAGPRRRFDYTFS